MIEKANEADLNAIFEIEKKTFITPWSQQSILESINKNEILVLRDANEVKLHQSTFFSSVSGFLIAQQVFDEASLLQIAIDPSVQGKGYGKELCQFWLENLNDEVKVIWVEARASNVIAQAMYQSLGFCKFAERKRYYMRPDNSAKEDAYIYRLSR